MSKIEWTQETWNLFLGCSKVSEGCKNCYSERMAFRIASMDTAAGTMYRNVISPHGKWMRHVEFNESALKKPYHWKKPRLIFVNSMSDTFHESVSSIWLRKMFEVIKDNPRHTFMILTKRPEMALAAYLSKRLDEYFPLPNVWLGVTAEDQEQAIKRIPILLKIPAAKRFVSIEPQLGPVDIIKYSHIINESGFNDYGGPFAGRDKLDWVICGAESGPGRRPFNEDWARVLRNQCFEAGTPFFYKQRFDNGKKISLPELDGVVYNQMPIDPPSGILKVNTAHLTVPEMIKIREQLLETIAGVGDIIIKIPQDDVNFNYRDPSGK